MLNSYIEKRIVLIGMPASGKSTFGKVLASSLEFSFIDTDEYIEKKYKMRIISIFNLVGEEGFRKLEHVVLCELLKISNVVISTGGGLPCFFDNIVLINRHATSVYILAEMQTLAERIFNSRKNRPLTQGFSFEELFIYVNNTLQSRAVFYENAKIFFNPVTDSLSDLKQKLL